MTHPSMLYTGGFSIQGESCSWASRFAPPGGAAQPVAPIRYDTRRLDPMTAFAVSSALDALARSGLAEAELSNLAIVEISHNGPCIYSEDFFRQLAREPNPQLVSPTLFAESVLNIVPTHISLAIHSQGPVYALNADLPGLFQALETVFLLFETGQCEHALLCACEEFSPIARVVLAACPDFPGGTFINGAMSLVVHSQKPPHPSVGLHAPGETPDPNLFLAELQNLQRRGFGRVVLSAYSREGPGLLERAGLQVSPSFLSGAAMKDEQGFMVTRLAEVLDLIRMAHEGASSVLVQVDRDCYRWIAACLQS